jgi:hypothetical protein
MSMVSQNTRSWLYYSLFTLCAAMTQSVMADSGPSEDWLKSLYSKRITEDNAASEQFFGKQGRTKLHSLKKVSCQNIAGTGSTQSCMIMVDITSYGLGRHKLNDQIVVRQNSSGQWLLISDVFN